MRVFRWVWVPINLEEFAFMKFTNSIADLCASGFLQVSHNRAVAAPRAGLQAEAFPWETPLRSALKPGLWESDALGDS